MSTVEVANASNVNMAGRAEARRRRILENSAARLARITGKQEEEEPDEKDTHCHEIPPSLPTIEQSIDNIDDAYTFHQDRLNFIEESPSPVFELIGDPSESDQSPKLLKQKSLLDIFIESRLHIVLISVMIQALYMSMNVIDGYLFLPLILWEVAEIFIFDSFDRRPRLSIILSVLHLSQFKHNILLRFLKIIFQFSEDALFYVFTFIVMQFIMVAINKVDISSSAQLYTSTNT